MWGSSVSRVNTALVVLALTIVLIPNLPVDVQGPGPSQPSTFFLHKQSSKTLNTITTTLWANTTQLWASTTQTEQRSASRSSPGVWDFYTEPVLAGNVTFTGPLTFTLYLLASSSTGAGTVITGTVSMITSAGTVVPLAVASLSNAPVTMTLSVYTLTIVSNTYQVEAGAIFDFTITVSIPGNQVRTITLYYDSPSYQSHVSITFQSRIGLVSFASYNQTGVEASFFNRNWTAPARQATLRASLFDALGLYDIAAVNTNITSPTGSVILTNSPLSRIQGSDLNYTGTYSLNVTYSENDPSGVYAANLAVIDNVGVSLSLQLSYTIFALWRLDLRTVSQDPAPLPVQGVSVTIFAGAVGVFSGTSNASGWVASTGILLRDDATYTINAYWQGYQVNQTISYIPISSLSLPLSLTVNRIDFNSVFRDGNGNLLPQSPSTFRLAHPNGTVTSQSGSAIYILPAGSYSISGVMWRGVDVTPATVSFNPRNGPPTFSLQIYDATLLVVNQDGQVLPGAQVTLSLGGQIIAQGTTATDGVLAVPNLPRGQYIVQVEYQSQTTTSTLDLTQNVSSRVQVNLAPSSAWIGQTLGWVLIVGAAVGGLVGYRQFTRSRLAFKEEPFEYFDSLTGGGFRSGDTVLIVGDLGTGKTTICEQLAYKTLTGGNPVIFLSYDKPDNVRSSMKSFRWDPSQFETTHQFQLVSCEISSPETNARGFGILENFYDITALNISINSALDELTMPKPSIFIDSLTPLVERASLSGLVNLLQEITARVEKMQGQMFLTVDKSVARSVLTRVEETVDSVIELAQVIEGGKTSSELRIKRMRGRKFDNKPIRMRVDSRKGIVFQVRRTIHGGPVIEEKPIPVQQKKKR